MFVCQSCGQEFGPRASGSAPKCPACGEAYSQRRSGAGQGSETHPVPPPVGEPGESADTLLHPRVSERATADRGTQARSLEGVRGDETIPRTEHLATSPGVLSPPLRLDAEAYLMVVGARRGSERLDLSAARTSFGREEADVNLSDRTVSRRHFQIEAMGREFFIRDLDSHNGTFLNGSKIRYSQLLPGDEIVAGNTALIFRLSDDGIDRSPR